MLFISSWFIPVRASTLGAGSNFLFSGNPFIVTSKTSDCKNIYCIGHCLMNSIYGYILSIPGFVLCYNISMKNISRKQQQDTEFEKVEAMGSDNNKTGIEATKSILKEEEREQKEKEALQIEHLNHVRKLKKNYIEFLAKMLWVRLGEDVMPQGVSYKIAPTELGVYMEMYINNRMFSQAFKASGVPFYDLNAVEVFIERAEVTVNKICRNPQITKKN